MPVASRRVNACSSRIVARGAEGARATIIGARVTRPMRDIAYIALGSNLGDRDTHLARARAALAALPECRLLAVSRIEETAPLGGPAQGPYLNQMAALETTLAPDALLASLQRIERDAGRVRDERWAARTLDLDIVAFAAQTIAGPALTVPHPGLATRGFWQRELAELGAIP